MPITIEVSKSIYHIPTFNELTIKHLIDLRKVDINKPLEIICWALGSEPKLYDTKESEIEISNVLKLSGALINEVTDWMQSPEKLKIPEHVNIMGEIVKIKPDMINDLPYWGTIITKEVISENLEDYTDSIPKIISHYLYPIVAKSMYDEDKADDFIEVINEMNLKEAVQLGNFFLLKQLKFSKFNLKYWRILLMRMKNRLASIFLKNTELSIH